MAYEDTVLDRAKLERYAHRVARELGGTENGAGSRWFLDRRVTGSKSHFGRGDYSEQHDVESFYLERDGTLTCDWESWEDGISGGRFWTGGKERGEMQPLTDFSILLFDHEYLNPTRRVRVHAKGVGLSLRLKKLLDDVPPSR